VDAKLGSMSHMRAVRTPLSCSRVALAVLVAHLFHEGLATSISSSAVISSSGDAQDMEGKGRGKGKGKGKAKRGQSLIVKKPMAHDGRGSGPATIIAGVSDSGTRGVEEAVMDLGWQVCKDSLVPGSLDSKYTNDLHDNAFSLLKKAGRSFGKQSKYIPEFRHAVLDETDDAKQIAECIRSSGGDLAKPWGYKNPFHIFLLPVLDSAFERKTKYLLVARDPRDAASAHNQFQFEYFGRAMSLNDGKDRWDYWADVWKMVLDYYEDSDHARVIRIEDLVMPDPETNSKLYKVCDFMQLPLCSQDKVVTALTKMHSFKSEYMGHHYQETAQDRQRLVNEVLARRDQGYLFECMGRLGYKVNEFGLTSPTSKLVL